MKNKQSSMECYYAAAVSNEGEPPWSDSHSIMSEDGHSFTFGQSPPWLEPPSAASSTSTSMSSVMSTSQSGQLSPVSNDWDPSSAASSGPAMHHSAPSSCTDLWSVVGCDHDEDSTGFDADDFTRGFHWDLGSDGAVTVPKLEPMDDDLCLDDVKAAPSTPASGTDLPPPPPPPTKGKRPRGRPRKHPLAPIVTTNKAAKGRSKTGCLTCRKRKKKCDEAKPRCMNCEKNAVVCEGYPEKHLWRSGKEKALQEPVRRPSQPMLAMPPIFPGLETAEDMVFWKYYNEHLSTVLTVEGERQNAFREMMIPIAVQHRGLMHSILSLASKHMDPDTPYGRRLLKSQADVDLTSLQRRSDFHHEKAVELLYADIAVEADKSSPEYQDSLAARYGQMLCLLLESIAEGNPRGEHRWHLQAYQTMIRTTPPEDPAFHAFISEFFQYHIFADDLFRSAQPLPLGLPDAAWVPSTSMQQPARLLGVADGLFNHMAKITALRNLVRGHVLAGLEPAVDYNCLYQAAELDAAIREWSPTWPPGDSRDRVGQLYQKMLWIHLFRTIYPPSASAAMSAQTPPRSGLASCASSPRPHSSDGAVSFGPLPLSPPPPAPPPPPPQQASPRASNPPSRKPSGSEHDHAGSAHGPLPLFAFGTHDDAAADDDDPDPPTTTTTTTTTPAGRAISPGPTRRPASLDARVTQAVDEALALLETLSPSDPSQTLLLLPCLVVGTACFAAGQRERLRRAVRAVRGYTGARNADLVAALLAEVWRLMDRAEWLAVWDWQGVAKRMQLDFLCA